MEVTLVAVAVLQLATILAVALAASVACSGKKDNSKQQQSAVSQQPNVKSVNPVSAPKAEEDKKPEVTRARGPQLEKENANAKDQKKQESEKRNRSAKNRNTVKDNMADGTDQGYENCNDMTPSQLEKIAKGA